MDYCITLKGLWFSQILQLQSFISSIVLNDFLFEYTSAYALETIVIIDDSDDEINDDDAMPELVDESRQDAKSAYKDHDYGPLPKIVSVLSATDQLNLTDIKERTIEE